MNLKVKSKLSAFIKPFKRITGKQAILTGLVMMTLTIVFYLINYVLLAESGKNRIDLDNLTNAQKTINIKEAFEKDDYKAISVYFDETMKKALPDSRLRKIWKQLKATSGKYKKSDLNDFEETKIGTHSVFEVAFTFQNDIISLRLVFNEEGKVIGLFFQ